jgi:hypothetical protein
MTMSDPDKAASGPAPAERDELYRQWLAVRYSHPSYYGLLGLAELEDDEEAIQQAGRKAKRTLRAYQIGTYRAEALVLLQEVGQAVAALTNAEKKREYDRDLRARWTAAIRELYHAHCDGAARDAAVLEVWLRAAADRGVPVTRLLPSILRDMTGRMAEWPAEGAHSLPVPVNLWLYRDAVILGYGLKEASLEHRASAVKHIQKVLGLSEGLARLVAEEITRDTAAFSRLRMLARARRDPLGLLVSLGARVRRFGGSLGRSGKVVVAMASLLGVKKRDMADAVERLKNAPRRPPVTARKSAGDAKDGSQQDGAADRGPGALRQLLAGVFGRPQGIIVALAVLVGIVAVALAVAVATDLWTPWKKPESPPAVTPTDAAVTDTDDSMPPDESDTEAFKEWIKKYPLGKTPPAMPKPTPTAKPRDPAKPPAPAKPRDGAAKPVKPSEPARPREVVVDPNLDSPDTAPAPATTFFSVPAVTRTDSPKPPKKKPAATRS